MADIKYVGGGSINLSRSLKSSCFAIKQIDAGAEARLSFLNFFTLQKTLLQNSVSVKTGISCRNEKIVMKIARVSSF